MQASKNMRFGEKMQNVNNWKNQQMQYAIENPTFVAKDPSSNGEKKSSSEIINNIKAQNQERTKLDTLKSKVSGLMDIANMLGDYQSNSDIDSKVKIDQNLINHQKTKKSNRKP